MMARSDEQGKARKHNKSKNVPAKKGSGKDKLSSAGAPQSDAAKRTAITLTPEFIADLKEVFIKHNWCGHPIGFVSNPAAGFDAQPCDPGPDTCPEGKELAQEWVHCPDGTSILRNYCR